jgi:hypothetical protein
MTQELTLNNCGFKSSLESIQSIQTIPISSWTEEKGATLNVIIVRDTTQSIGLKV